MTALARARLGARVRGRGRSLGNEDLYRARGAARDVASAEQRGSLRGGWLQAWPPPSLVGLEDAFPLPADTRRTGHHGPKFCVRGKGEECSLRFSLLRPRLGAVTVTRVACRHWRSCMIVFYFTFEKREAIENPRTSVVFSAVVGI